MFGQGRSVGRFPGVPSHGVASGGEGGLGGLVGGQSVRPLHGHKFGHVVDYGKPGTDGFVKIYYFVLLVVTSGGRGLCHCPF